MQRIRYYYLIKLQYLGFRFHGWQKQPDVITVEKMVDRTVSFVLGRKNFKLLASGRTDAKVSVNQTFVELFVDEEPINIDEFLSEFNKNLPPDIRALAITETNQDFNIINHPKQKEYLYFFAYGEKFHPFCAPFMTYMKDDLAIELMQEGAKLFEGEHDFWSYAFRPKPETKTQGKIDVCKLVENDIYSANFFPEKSYVLRVKGKGFKRHQIRLMMGVLFDLGRGEINLDFIKQTLNAANRIKLEHIAQPSGLILNEVSLND
ncbi:tRNA pseudouridine synthase A [Mesonia aestuariivivens]|uniref:tRNA pseudouridine synthase A n=1 Tax=Mesonia aestuariivivens TaxID=2796128 RepID=A0ABS6W4H1_9FLAO|nr:tRNA pseudouridine(38-40) synthase TruA [Mesonia aestuariivivens]MBW2962750.1 tRNA pseudouridine(38-40) synthase TruA [Mesonia aestuariivivens]